MCNFQPFVVVQRDRASYYSISVASQRRKSSLYLPHQLGHDTPVVYGTQQILVASEYYCVKAFLKALAGVLIPGSPEPDTLA